jgi:primase-polymerase (primpol)-like protein
VRPVYEIRFLKFPTELRKPPQWVNWCAQLSGSRATKIPVDSHNGGLASCSNVRPRGTFQVAVTGCSKIHQCGALGGTGVVITDGLRDLLAQLDRVRKLYEAAA